MSINNSNINHHNLYPNLNNTSISLFSDDNVNKTHNKKNYSFVVQNIRSLRKNFDLFLAELINIDESPLFIFLTEIFIYDNEVENYKIDNYIAFANCNNSYKSGGVIVYSRSDIKCEFFFSNINSCDILRVNTTINGHFIVFICVYRLHSCSIKIFCDDIANYLNKIKCKNLIFVGDININLMDININVDYLHLMSSFGLISYVNHVTRPVSGSCLDHTFARLNSDVHLVVHVLDTCITDHSTLYGIFEFGNNCQFDTKNIISHSKKINYKSLNEFLVKESWDDIYGIADPNIAYNILMTKLKSYIEKSSHTIAFKKKFIKLKPWISYDLSKKICYKNNLSKKAKKFPNNKILQEKVITLLKEIKIETARTKEKFYLNKFIKNGSNSKKNWDLINEIISLKSKDNEIPDEILSNNNIILHDAQEIANEFNEYFVNNASKSKNDFNQMNSRADLYHKTYDKSMFINPVSPIELINIIGSLENKTSLDADGLSNNIIKNICFSIVDILCYIFNLSFTSGIVPNKLKNAVVLSFYKKGNKMLKENYRPISILPVLSKILEKLMKCRILNFLTEIKFFSNCQFGFRETLNTESALLEVLNNVYSKLNIDLKCAGVGYQKGLRYGGA